MGHGLCSLVAALCLKTVLSQQLAAPACCHTCFSNSAFTVLKRHLPVDQRNIALREGHNSEGAAHVELEMLDRLLELGSTYIRLQYLADPCEMWHPVMLSADVWHVQSVLQHIIVIP